MVYHQDKKRSYWQCQRCQFVYVPGRYWLVPDAEKSEYDLHENSLSDAGYLRFLRRLGDPLINYLPPQSTGLDFGCGPAPLLAKWLAEQGYQMSRYDKFYAPEADVFNARYDFICATEVVEHLRNPGLTLQALWSCLNDRGVLALMTKRVQNLQAFSRWHYKNDPTHIGFFSENSFNWLAEHWRAELRFPAADVALFIRR